MDILRLNCFQKIMMQVLLLLIMNYSVDELAWIRVPCMPQSLDSTTVSIQYGSDLLGYLLKVQCVLLQDKLLYIVPVDSSTIPCSSST